MGVCCVSLVVWLGVLLVCRCRAVPYVMVHRAIICKILLANSVTRLKVII